MPVREILLLGNPKLWEPSQPVTDIHSTETHETIADLASTLEAFRGSHGFGRAIAAPQIGAQRRIILVNIDQPMPLINPAIVEASTERMELWDDCFSFPDLMVRVSRHARIAVRYSDEHGEVHTLSAENGLSELLQHEIDHLDGILATDRAIGPRSFAMRSEIVREMTLS
jgi:peptide deformylase